MKDTLAEKLLVKVMNWDEPTIAKERPILQSLSNLKYDGYQQFSPGLRFIESLAIWLNQFETKEEKELIYNELVRRKLIYISIDEITHFISLVYTDIVQPFIINQAAKIMGKDPSLIKYITKQKEFEALRRKTLFLGLSDGAQIGTFRRFNPSLSNEQVWLTYDFSVDKMKDLKKDLQHDLITISTDHKDSKEDTFNTIVLLDDFSGSGKSFIRKQDGTFKGKISKILKQLLENNANINLVGHQCNIMIILYVATENAQTQIESHVEEFLDQDQFSDYNIKINVYIVQKLHNNTRIDDTVDNELVDILKKYFDNSIVDQHWSVGDISTPYFGFDMGALPLVLFHNTPNNSLPILWSSSSRSVALFPRVTRHKE